MEQPGADSEREQEREGGGGREREGVCVWVGGGGGCARTSGCDRELLPFPGPCHSPNQPGQTPSYHHHHPTTMFTARTVPVERRTHPAWENRTKHHATGYLVYCIYLTHTTRMPQPMATPWDSHTFDASCRRNVDEGDFDNHVVLLVAANQQARLELIALQGWAAQATVGATCKRSTSPARCHGAQCVGAWAVRACRSCMHACVRACVR